MFVTRQPASSSPDGVAQNLYYTLRDRLGSTLAVVDDLNMAASQIDHRDYDAYGRVRDPSLAALPFLTGLNLSPQTTHGFTNQDHVDSVKLIHMGGRVYDYTLGRFLSVDPVIQNKGNSQSLNPYSYILNNPLAGRDPTGYCTTTTGTHFIGGNAPKCEDAGVSVMDVAPSAAEQKAADNHVSRSIVASLFRDTAVAAQTPTGTTTQSMSDNLYDIGNIAGVARASPVPPHEQFMGLAVNMAMSGRRGCNASARFDLYRHGHAGR